MKKLIAAYLFCCLLLLSGSHALAADKVVCDMLSVDPSNCMNGTIKVTLVNPESETRYKLGVALNGQCYYYDLEPEKEVVVPLQMGNGAYLLLLLQNAHDNLYSIVSKAKVYAKPDPNRIWLESNVKVNFTSSDTISRLKSELKRIGLRSSDSASVKYQKITTDTRYGFAYDHIAMIKRLPQTPYADLDRILSRRMGLCEELSALTVALLRLEGIPAKLVIGRANGADHAWVEAFIDNETKVFDPTVIEERQEKVIYTPERYY